MKDIFYYGFSKKEVNENFCIYYNKDTKIQYFNNLLSLNKLVSSENLMEIENKYIERLKTNGQPNSTLTFPFNTSLNPEMYRYLEKKGYDIQIQEVYAVTPDIFLTKNKLKRAKLSISIVNSSTLKEAVKYGYKVALAFGEDYALFKQNYFIPKQFQDENTEIIIAKIDDHIVGMLYLHETDGFIELDGFDVSEKNQHQGIGTAMQIYAMEHATSKNKDVFLIADSDDTPRIMYKKQGYILQGFYYYAHKIL